jgi:hypothetical protein
MREAMDLPRNGLEQSTMAGLIASKEGFSGIRTKP